VEPVAVVSSSKASREFKERRRLSEAWLDSDQQGTTDALESESVMNVKVINKPYMIHNGTDADAYDIKTFNLPYLESVIGNPIESGKKLCQ
jgi:hypothetical protein